MSTNLYQVKRDHCNGNKFTMSIVCVIIVTALINNAFIQTEEMLDSLICLHIVCSSVAKVSVNVSYIGHIREHTSKPSVFSNLLKYKDFNKNEDIKT